MRPFDSRLRLTNGRLVCSFSKAEGSSARHISKGRHLSDFESLIESSGQAVARERISHFSLSMTVRLVVLRFSFVFLHRPLVVPTPLDLS